MHRHTNKETIYIESPWDASAQFFKKSTHGKTLTGDGGHTKAPFPSDVTDLGANSQVTKANNY